MADVPTPAKGSRTDPVIQQDELVVSPPEDPAIVADTVSSAMESGNVAASGSVDTEGVRVQGTHIFLQREETRLRIGPLPDPRTLRELNEIYPNAAKIIFDEFRAPRCPSSRARTSGD